MFYALSESQGAALLIGPFGSGKSLVLHALVAGLPETDYATGYLTNSLMSPAEVVLSAARALGSEDLPESAAEVSESYAQRRLEDRLAAIAAGGQRAVLALDDAHAISNPEVWEALRQVLGLGSDGRALLTLLLAGNQDLPDKVEAAPGFAERVAVRVSLVALTEEESLNYVLHRLARAGAARGIFTRSAAERIARLSGGLPSRINHLADLSLAAAYGLGLKVVGPEVVNMVAEDLEKGKLPSEPDDGGAAGS